MSEDRKEISAPAEEPAGVEDQKVNLASRARNRTVMLTPDVAGHVRSLIGNDAEGQRREQTGELVPANPGTDYERPRGMPASGFGVDGFSVRDNQRPSSTPWQTGVPPVDYGRGVSRGGQPGSPLHAVQNQGLPPNAAPRGAGRVEPAKAAAPKSRIIAFLISFDKNRHGEIFELRVGRWIISSRPIEHGEHILIDDETISPLHGILRITEEGKIQVLDQLSEFGTGVTPFGSTDETEVVGAMIAISHGDVIRFGKRRFMTCVVPTIES